jgi:hypothetical protein
MKLQDYCNDNYSQRCGVFPGDQTIQLLFELFLWLLEKVQGLARRER